MAQNISPTVTPTAALDTASGEHTGNRLGAFLCWSVVFADIGTSVYYVPGILYGQVGSLAGLFVTLTLAAFALLTLKYAEVSVRFPEGGGVVTVSARGLNPWAGAVGGMFILVDYFLTSAISSISGVEYFVTSFFPKISGDIVLIVVVTLIMIALLGLLNWWGIKESAAVSAVFAVAAFISDVVILVSIFGTLSLAQILHYIRLMFSTPHISGVTLLTGYAGAFLAFSGLESISQLSPVMRIPRHKTVTVALALVAITVGITSPLLTFFSTTALLDLHKGAPIDPNTFISALGLQFGGRIVEAFTAITASLLLVFASNTAIIGAYHVFLALSRMQFFPQVIEKTNKWRGTPHVSIFFATVIPMAVLLAVRGNVNTLGDMYAFGLLGAFSMTCVALDVIRFRERRGETVAGAHSAEFERENTPESSRHSRMVAFTARLGATALMRISPAVRARLHSLHAQATAKGSPYLARVRSGTKPLLLRVRDSWWPTSRYYLGFLTTFLIVIAWATNLVAKPLATEFGGGLTVLGVGISVINYHRRQRMGETPIFPMSILRRIPDSRLVVLTGEALHNEAVIRAATESTDGHALVFVYLGKPIMHELQPLAINDPYFRDDRAKRTFSRANAAARNVGAPAYFIYRIGGSSAVLNIWRVVQPDEIITEARSGKSLSTSVAPEYVRFQHVDDVKVAHYMRHHVPAPGQPEDGVPFVATQHTPPAPRIPEAPIGTDLPRAESHEEPPRVAHKPIPKKITGMPSSGTRRAPSNGATTNSARTEGASPSRTAASAPGEQVPPQTESPSDHPTSATPGLSGDIDEYVWTGTQLVRKSELEPEPPQNDGGSESEK